MNEKVEKDFAVMVVNLLQTEFCKDWNPRLLHGFMGMASEAGELLEKYSSSIEVGGVVLERTDTLVELSDLLHYMQMIIGTLNSSITEVKQDYSYLNSGLGRGFFDGVAMHQHCERLDPILLRGFIGISSRTGELLNRYKKFMFYHGEPFTRDEILIELSKLLFYIQMILDRFDSSIEEVMCINMAKLGSRYPDGYAHDKAITHLRDKKAERATVDKVIDTFAAMREQKDLGYGIEESNNGEN